MKHARFYGEELLDLAQTGRSPLVSSPGLFIQYICSYYPWFEAVPSVCNLRTCHSLVTRVTMNKKTLFVYWYMLCTVVQYYQELMQVELGVISLKQSFNVYRFLKTQHDSFLK
jgi:hypothetical protein